MSFSNYSLAEVEEESFKDKHRACAAENSQGLTSQQTEHCPRQCRTQETFQHTLQRSTDGEKKKKTHIQTLHTAHVACWAQKIHWV